MEKQEKKDFPFYTFKNLSSYTQVLHFVSSGAKNIGFTEGTIPAEIIKNRQTLATAVGFDLKNVVMGHQVHAARVAMVTSKMRGCGAMDKESRIPDTDALVTNQPDICLVVLSADCVPVLLYDPICRVIAAVHAGWRGTVAKIAGETVQLMQEKYGCNPKNILAAIGPSIGKCCFEVGVEVAEQFRQAFPVAAEIIGAGKVPGKYQVDLWEANRRILVGAGLQPGHVEIAGICSVCHTEKFFSYRRDGKNAGRFGAGIMLIGQGGRSK